MPEVAQQPPPGESASGQRPWSDICNAPNPIAVSAHMAVLSLHTQQS